MSRQFTVNAIIAAALIPAAATASAQRMDVTDAEFVERPGVMEFSGRMMAKSLTVQQAVAEQGVSEKQARLQISDAVAMIQPYVIHYEAGMDTYVFTLPDGATEEEVARELLATGQFEWVEPDWLVYPADCPNDPQFGNQWHHNNMESCDAWDIHIGSTEIIVATCDTGVNVNHEDLRGNNVPGYNAPNRRSEENGGQIGDINGHGTWVTGCYGAIGNNSLGVSGVCQSISYMPVRITNSSGGGAFQSDINNGVLWAVDNGARIANVSYSGVETSSVATLGSQVAQRGAWLVYAGGNEGRQLNNRMWDSDEVVAVSASTSSDRKAGFSNYGNIMDVIAPGSFVRTTNRFGGYDAVSGTSFAAPVAAGVMALVWSADPNLDRYEVYDALIGGVDDLGSTGWDSIYANGRVNSRKSLEFGTVFRLDMDDSFLQGGEQTTFFVRNGDPNTPTGLFYSLRGEGSTFIPALGINIGLENAQQAAPILDTNGIGALSWTVNVPRPPRTLLVWIQSGQATGNVSNVILTQVNR